MNNYFHTAKNFLAIFVIFAISLAITQPLPPEIPWKGKTEKLIKKKGDVLVTPSELSVLTKTPNYQATIKWFKAFAKKSKHVTLQSIAKTDEDRDVWMAVITHKGHTKAEQLDKKIPTLLMNAGIHAGEIDGKDAGMMVLRDIVLDKPEILKKINILFIPILSPDGHEIISKYNRVNQRGPKKMGWRTNARNLNLNRDWAKLELPEVQGIMKIMTGWPVDMWIDLHVSDGMDYQYDITWSYVITRPYSKNVSAWLDKEYTIPVTAYMQKMDHIPGPQVMTVDKTNPKLGNYVWRGSIRYSDGYGDARHLPTVLVENHSLKSYKQRVLGNYVFIEASINALAKNFKALRRAVKNDRAARPKKIPMGWKFDTAGVKPVTVDFLGVDYKMIKSPITGVTEQKFLGKKINQKIKLHSKVPEREVTRPKAYWIPVTHRHIMKKLRMHGIKVDVIKKAKKVKVEQLKIKAYQLADYTFEGRVTVKIDTTTSSNKQITYRKGSARVSTNQPLGDLLMLLLEPYSEDSFLQWGFMHEIFQRTEYIEGYVMDPMAKAMMKKDPKLKKAFEKALKDKEFAGDRRKRMRWFYERSPWYDPRHLVYPIAREN